jgi:hypothetical protein
MKDGLQSFSLGSDGADSTAFRGAMMYCAICTE